MILDITKAKLLTYKDYPSIPDYTQLPFKRFKCGSVTINYYKSVRTISREDYIFISHSLVAFYNNEPRFILSVEKQDLRSLSNILNTSLRELQKEYNTRSFLVNPTVVLYANGEKEEFGPLSTEEKDEYILPYLFDILLDSLDLIDEVIPLD